MSLDGHPTAKNIPMLFHLSPSSNATQATHLSLTQLSLILYTMKKTIFSIVLLSAGLFSSCNSTIQQLGGTLLQGALGTDGSTSSVSGGNTVTALLGGLLEGVLGNSSLTEQNILGTWNYSGSSVVFESSNALQRIGGSAASSAIEQKVDAQLSNLGFNRNSCQFTFNSDNSFTGKIAGRSFSGTYKLDTTNNKIKLTYLSGLSHTTVHVALNSGKLSLLFEADKFKTILTTLGGLSGNATISTLSDLLGSYDGMLVGLELSK